MPEEKAQTARKLDPQRRQTHRTLTNRRYKASFPKGPRYCYGGYFRKSYNSNSKYRNPIFYYKGTLDPLGLSGQTGIEWSWVSRAEAEKRIGTE